MSDATYFFIVLLATIAAARMLLRNKSLHGPTVHGWRVHHYVYGVVLMGVGAILGNLTLYAVGWGLFIDELPDIIRNSWGWANYYSITNDLGVLTIVILLYIFRGYIVL